jgi:hypothetical protein
MRISPTRRIAVAAAAFVAAFAAACGSDSNSPTIPKVLDPVIGVSATAMSSSSVKVTFTSRSGDNSFTIERAEGSGNFAQAGTVAAPATPGTVAYTDNGLKVNTQYRYRVTATAGSITSAPSSEVLVVTPNVGNAAADITTDISASRTLYADTVYTLKASSVANGATLHSARRSGRLQHAGVDAPDFARRKLQAVGTADLPIVMTSSRPIGNRQPGDWVGLVFVGNAPAAGRQRHHRG